MKCIEINEAIMKISMVSSYELSSCYKDVNYFNFSDELSKLKAFFLCRHRMSLLKCQLDLNIVSLNLCLQCPFALP